MGNLRVRAVGLVAILLGIGFTAPAEATAGNFLPNGGFESCSGCSLNQKSTPDQWTAALMTNAWGGWSARDAYEGTYSWYGYDNHGSDGFVLTSYRDAAIPGATYTASVYLKQGPSVAGGTFVLHLDFFTASGSPAGSTSTSKVATVAWQQMTLSAVAGTSVAKVQLRISSSAANRGDAHFDAATITENGGAKPRVTIDSPANGARVKDAVSIQGSVSANGGLPVRFVEISIDGGIWRQANFVDPGWSYGWNTLPLANGWHQVAVRAGTGRQYSDPPTVSNFEVYNYPPNVTIDPLPSTVKGVFTVTGTANNGGLPVQLVQVSVVDSFQVNPGTWQNAVATGTNWATWKFDWDTRALNNPYYAKVWARSWNGYQYSSAVLKMTTAANPAPTVSIETFPNPVSGRFTIAGSAGDNGGEPVQRVEVSAPGLPAAWAVANGTPGAWSVDWETRKIADGWHTVNARAWNGYRWSWTASLQARVSNPTPTIAITTPPPTAPITDYFWINGTTSANGGDPVTQVKVALDGVPIGTATGTSSWSFKWNTWSTDAGMHRLTFTATNGWKTSAPVNFDVIVRVKSELAPTEVRGYYLTLPANADVEMPDFCFDFRLPDPDPLCGIDLPRIEYETHAPILEARIVNTGGRATAFRVDFYAASIATALVAPSYSLACSTTVGGLGAGNYYTTSAVASCAAGGWKLHPGMGIRVVVDALNQVPEGNEANNAMERTVLAGPYRNSVQLR